MTAPITPEVVAQHGLTADAYEQILRHLGRAPTPVELGVFSVMWSEHRSRGAWRAHLESLPTTGPRVLLGPGESAGVVDLGDGLAAAFTMAGEVTGLGGAFREVLTVGARPIASMNSLRLGDPTHPRTADLLEAAVAGIGGQGNRAGVPAVGGEVAFHPAYDGSCLVNTFALGVLPKDAVHPGPAAAGDPVMYVGARTGRDGIPAGDPATGKSLLEACLELFRAGAVAGVKDAGAAGLTAASIVLAGRAGNGLDLFLDQVPLREEGMTPAEILRSGSQERLLLVAAPGKEDVVRRVCTRWGLDVAVVGKVTAGGRWRAHWHGEAVADLPLAPLAGGAPRHDRPGTPHPALPAQRAFDPATLPEPDDLGEVLLRLLARPTIASKEWVYRQYDSTVRLGTVVGPGGDAAVVRLATGEHTHPHRGVALSIGANGRWCFLDPYLGAQHAVAECARNIACVGGEPIALAGGLDLGDPRKPEITWQLAECVRGLGDACRAFGTPVVSGHVSFHEGTGGRDVLPTPTVAMVGLVEKVETTCTPTFKTAGDLVVVVGGLSGGGVGGSEYLSAEHGEEAGTIPALDLAREKAVQATVRRAVKEGLLSSAHDCSDGGLAVALAECCMMGSAPTGKEPRHLGAALRIPFGARKDFVLFGEDASRIVVSLPHLHLARLEAVAQLAGAPLVVLGAVGGDRLEIQSALSVPVAELSAAWRDGIPTVLRRDAGDAAVSGVAAE